MKITHNKVGQNLNLTDANRAERANSSAVDSKKTEAKTTNVTDLRNNASDAVKVDLSSRAQDIQKIRDIAKNSPEVDQAKVDKFQKLIDSGKYKVDSKAVASRMVDEFLGGAKESSNE